MSDAAGATQQVLKITINDYRAVATAADRWQLNIVWQFGNLAEQIVYLLLSQPLLITLTEPLILDHSAHEPELPIDAYADPEFSIVTITPHAIVQRQMQYQLGIPAHTPSLRVVGRFGYSLVAPDPAWERGKNWQQIERWQQIAESQPLVVAPQP